MTNNLTTVDGIIEDVKLREDLISRVEVLEKVKGLLLLPNTEFATVQQVAEFYEVDVDAIESIIRRNGDELASDGFSKMTGGEVKELVTVNMTGTNSIINKRGYFLVETAEGFIKMANRSNGLFPRRAILRVGMLLRDSKVAREVRNQLLNIEAKASSEVKTEDTNKLGRLMAKIIKANNDIDRMAAVSELHEFDNCYVRQAEQALKKIRTVHEATLDNFVTAKAIGERYLLDGRKVSGQKINQILYQQGYLVRETNGPVATDLGIQIGAKDKIGNNGSHEYTYVMWTNRVVETVFHPIFESYGLTYKTSEDLA